MKKPTKAKAQKPSSPIKTLAKGELITVSGGGSTAKEAYFVRCDRSTITP
jgi:hypothetical protein